jgi:hypothetical protein
VYRDFHRAGRLARKGLLDEEILGIIGNGERARHAAAVIEKIES